MTLEKSYIISKTDTIISSKGDNKKSLIPILQALQTEFNYLPQEALNRVAEVTTITPADITGVASFYSQFRMHPVGDHIIKVCVGTACHVKGAVQIYDAFKRHLKLKGDSITDAAGKYTLDKVSCLGCCTLAVVVQIDDVTYGHVTTDMIETVIHDFENQVGKTVRSKSRTSSESSFQGEIRVGLGSCCVASGSEDVKSEIENYIADSGIDVKLKNVGCVGMCHQVPLVEIVSADNEITTYAKVKSDDVRQIVNNHFSAGSVFKRVQNKVYDLLESAQTSEVWEPIDRHAIDVRDSMVANFLDNQIPIATEHRGVINPLDIDEYKQFGGFEALQNVLKIDNKEIISQLKSSGLRGRGGAGFSTGQKWEFAEAIKSDPKYIICNGDEGDPGAFMDRMLLESYPYRVIEGMLIAAKAVNATEGYFYIRAEYPLAVIRIRHALENCRQNNLLGKNILGSDFNFDVKIYEGAGAFVCGEETALISSIEGNRGFPRVRPPFPVQSGLWGKSTLINNTETLSMVPYIFREGADKFSKIGTANSTGTKVFSLTGKINRGGLIEVPMGVTIRDIVENIGGGVQNGKKFKAVQVGGPSGGCIPAELYDTPIDYQSLIDVGAMMGSGGLVVLDEDDCMVDIAKYFLSFTQDESCGKCTFCRVGTKRMLDILVRITEGKGSLKDIDELEYLAAWTQKGSLCNLGKSAPNPILTTLKYFRHEYEEHINGRCPSGKCTELIEYRVNDNCIGCTKCAQKCPVNAIAFEPHKKHTIDTQFCIKCDACKQVCPSDAIDIW